MFSSFCQRQSSKFKGTALQPLWEKNKQKNKHSSSNVTTVKQRRERLKRFICVIWRFKGIYFGYDLCLNHRFPLLEPRTSPVVQLVVLHKHQYLLSWLSLISLAVSQDVLSPGRKANLCQSLQQLMRTIPFQKSYKTFTYLGVTVTKNPNDLLWLNWQSKVELINIEFWKTLPISMVREINAIKMIVLPRFLHLFLSIQCFIVQSYFKQTQLLNENNSYGQLPLCLLPINKRKRLS